MNILHLIHVNNVVNQKQVCLKFYPHDKEIRFKSKRLGLNEESRKEVVKLIEKSKIVCFNCFIKYENDIIDIM